LSILARKGARSGRATCIRAGLELGDLIRLGLAGQLAHEVAAIGGPPTGLTQLRLGLAQKRMHHQGSSATKGAGPVSAPCKPAAAGTNRRCDNDGKAVIARGADKNRFREW
jgi:hypothetical protein